MTCVSCAIYSSQNKSFTCTPFIGHEFLICILFCNYINGHNVYHNKLWPALLLLINFWFVALLCLQYVIYTNNVNISHKSLTCTHFSTSPPRNHKSSSYTSPTTFDLHHYWPWTFQYLFRNLWPIPLLVLNLPIIGPFDNYKSLTCTFPSLPITCSLY